MRLDLEVGPLLYLVGLVLLVAHAYARAAATTARHLAMTGPRG